MPSTNNAEVRYTGLWRAVRDRLGANATLRQTLGSSDPLKPRVYVVDEDFTQPEGLESGPWGRVVIAPVESLWVQDNMDDPRRPKRAAFLLRSEINNFVARGYDRSLVLDGIQAQSYALLYLWAPALAALSYAIVIRPLFRWQAPQQTPIWDPDRSLWFTSSEWRTELIAPPSGS